MSIINQSRKYVLAIADFAVFLLSALFVKILIPFLLFGTHTDYSRIIRESFPLILIFSVLCEIGMIICQNYSQVWRYATMRDLIRCIGGVCIGVASTALGLRLFFPSENKLGISWSNIYFLAIVFLISSLIICLGRILYIIYSQARSSADNQKPDNVKKIMIIGAGYACKVLLNELQEDRSSDPVCIIDDDPNKISRSFRGVRIYGPMMLIPALCEKMNIDERIKKIEEYEDK